MITAEKSIRLRTERFFPTAMMTLMAALLLITSACGGGSSSQPSSPPPGAAALLQVNLGDSPADWIMAFGMNVNSIMLTNSSGGSVSLVSSSTPMEMMQLMGTMRPLAITNVPQGSYTQAVVTISSVSMAYMDPNTRQYMQKSVAGNASGTVTFNPPLTMGSASSVLSFDMDMSRSVSIDASGNVTLTPTFTANMSPVAGSGQNPWTGWMQHMTGSVSSVSGSQFSMGMMMGMQSLTFTTNSNTQFVGMSGMGMMGNGMIVAVDAVTQSDGSLLAQRVSSMESASGGMMADGILLNMSGNPPTQLNMVADDGIGNGMMMSGISGMIAVNVSSGTPYTFDSDDVDLSNLPFTPAFSSSTIANGQRIEAGSSSGMMGGGMMGGNSINANEVHLEQQGFHGAVSNYSSNGSQATFTLTLAPDSAFVTMAGTTSVMVFQQSGTQMRGLSSIANGNQVQVRGLLFKDAGVYKMVASWITQ